MSPEKTEILIQKYPSIFSNLKYFECGDGWFDIIDKLCSLLDQEAKNEAYRLPEEEAMLNYPVASQVKEKFGGLRFYIYGGNERMRGMISMAENFSFKICEGCGNKGSKKGKGWLYTMCNPCWHQYETRQFPKSSV